MHHCYYCICNKNTKLLYKCTIVIIVSESYIILVIQLINVIAFSYTSVTYVVSATYIYIWPLPHAIFLWPPATQTYPLDYWRSTYRS